MSCSTSQLSVGCFLHAHAGPDSPATLQKAATIDDKPCCSGHTVLQSPSRLDLLVFRARGAPWWGCEAGLLQGGSCRVLSCKITGVDVVTGPYMSLPGDGGRRFHSCERAFFLSPLCEQNVSPLGIKIEQKTHTVVVGVAPAPSLAHVRRACGASHALFALLARSIDYTVSLLSCSGRVTPSATGHGRMDGSMDTCSREDRP